LTQNRFSKGYPLQGGFPPDKQPPKPPQQIIMNCWPDTFTPTVTHTETHTHTYRHTYTHNTQTHTPLPPLSSHPTLLPYPMPHTIPAPRIDTVWLMLAQSVLPATTPLADLSYTKGALLATSLLTLTRPVCHVCKLPHERLAWWLRWKGLPASHCLAGLLPNAGSVA
jgi:hypothetical protein